MKRIAKNAISALYKYSGMMQVQERVAYWSGRKVANIVLFHRVTDEIPEDDLTVTTSWFRGFCQLMRARFNVVSLGELHRQLRSDETPALRTIAITFDDCYRDNLFAARVLAEHGLPATFFIPTAPVGTDHVFAWDIGLKRMANLTWADVREIQQLGHEIGSHSVSHPDMGEVGGDQAKRELSDSKKTLEDQLQRPVRFFAYPYGGPEHFRAEYLSLSYECGYDAVFSAIYGSVEPSMKRQVLPRNAMPYFRSLLDLELYLSGCLHWAYRIKYRAGMPWNTELPRTPQ